MVSHSFILFASETTWRIARITSGEISQSSAPSIQGVADALKQLEYEGQGTLLALPPSWCFSAFISTEDLPKHDRKAMLYRLEEKLPLPAEGLVADFVVQEGAEPKAFGVAVATEQLKGVIESLESADVAVQSIVPAALLVAQALPSVAGRDPYLLLAAEESEAAGGINLIEVAGGKAAAWALLPGDVADLKLQIELAMLDFNGSPHVEACGIPAGEVDTISQATGLVVTDRGGSPFETAARFGAEVLAGRQRPWVELRRGALGIQDSFRQHRAALNALLAAAAVLLLALAGVMIARGLCYDRLSASSDRQGAAAFQRQFPGWPVPGNVRAVVESEHRKASAKLGGSLPPEAQRSALQTLHDVLSKLPADSHFTVDRATFEDEGFQMEGRLRSYEEVDALANAARQAGLTVDTPQARKDADGFWTFTLHGSRSPQSQTAMAKPEGS